jgi:DNA-binding response OmpR family regulator
LKLLLVEDDPLIGEAMATGLRQAGFTVDWAHDGQEAESALLLEEYALLVLDLGLPRLDGMALLRRLRGAEAMLPVIVVTARDGVADRLEGLYGGADDYLVKPFDLDELIARVHVLLRRFQQRPARALELGGLRVEPVTRTVTLDGEDLSLSDREFRLLLTLMEKPGLVLSIEQLEHRLYGWGEEVASNTIEVQVHRLRKKLGRDWIRNIRGVGFKLVVPV